MNENDDATATRLRAQLHHQVDGWHGAPLTLEQVRGRARGIRRNRRYAAAGVAAMAVAALALPVGLLSSTTGRSDAPPDITDAPGLSVPYVTGRTLTLPDGTERELPRAYEEVVVWGEEVLGVMGTPGSADYAMEPVSGRNAGEVTIPLGGSSIARNADGSAIAYVTPSAHLVVESAAGRNDLGTLGSARGLDAVRPIRVLGGPDCVETDDCAVFFQDGDNAWLLGNLDGVPLGEGALVVRDVSENGLVAQSGNVDPTAPASCSVVSDRATGARVFRTCDHTLGRFSPGGTFVTGVPPYPSGKGIQRMSMLDATTGEELAAYEPRDGYVDDTRSVWEDADHLLVMAHELDDNTWSVVRLAVDGSEETVLGPAPAVRGGPPWTLAGGL